jgi:hypothetical protein
MSEGRRRSQLEKDTDLLFEYASNCESFTYDEVERDLGFSYGRFMRAARQVRILFASDRINLICEPAGSRERWTYRLVGRYSDAAIWHGNRTRDLETRLVTILSLAESIVNATAARTKDGQRARIIKKALGRLIEDLSDMTVQAA